MSMEIPSFNTKKERFAFMVKNKSLLIADKKLQYKTGDPINYSVRSFERSDTEKAIENPSTFDGDKIVVESVINTTNIMDSHDDVHIKGIWGQSLKQSKGFYLLQEHQMKFDKIISDEVKATTKNLSWVELGLGAEGETQALMFKSVIEKDRNPFMFEQYLKGRVKNHSVGMQYIHVSLAVNDEDFKEEFSVWNKYIDKIVNKDDAEGQGFFYAVTEAKIREGSAVPMGSNIMTPTLNINSKTEPPAGTPKEDNEPSNDTHKLIIKNFKL